TAMKLTADGRARVLNNGVPMPLLGLGVWQLRPGPATEQAVLWAFEAGYRHVDTAALYRNEESVGAAVRRSGLPREEVFVATKFHPRDPDPERSIQQSLRLLGMDYVDLYLWHWPSGNPTRHWAAFERIAGRGQARAVGVSNFGVDGLGALLRAAGMPPAVNQVEFSPFEYRRALLEACERAGVLLEAYSPLTRGRDLRHPTALAIARRHSRTPAQVLLRWAVQRGIPVIPKSGNRERIIENAQIFDFALTDEDMAALDALDRTRGTGSAH
ncbi:MAG TPA: aldo/keto reductase, partial [Mycobacteriales bacterium]|nr:aldo/keto reductase [Mycobacteriales bacterium]